MWLTPCGAVGVNFGNERFVSDEGDYAGDWSYFRLSYNFNAEGHRQTSVSVELDGADLISFDYEPTVYPRWEPEFHLGSYKGWLYHF